MFYELLVPRLIEIGSKQHILDSFVMCFMIDYVLAMAVLVHVDDIVITGADSVGAKMER